jgi:hypothetical protein
LPSLFYELELNIAGHKTLADCLEEFLKEEKLEGADRYHCTGCKSKQDATRSIKLDMLPSVLNLQLMRFVFDRSLLFAASTVLIYYLNFISLYLFHIFLFSPFSSSCLFIMFCVFSFHFIFFSFLGFSSTFLIQLFFCIYLFPLLVI